MKFPEVGDEPELTQEQADKIWDELFDRPESRAFLHRIAVETQADLDAGIEFEELDPDALED